MEINDDFLEKLKELRDKNKDSLIYKDAINDVVFLLCSSLNAVSPIAPLVKALDSASYYLSWIASLEMAILDSIPVGSKVTAVNAEEAARLFMGRLTS